MSQMMMTSYPKPPVPPPVTKMVAGDLCCDCGLSGDVFWDASDQYSGAHYTAHAPCPICTHQTPAERVVEAARAVARCTGLGPSAAEHPVLREFFDALSHLGGNNG